MADLTGTGGNDTLAGTAEADLIEGLGGNDDIDGKDGADTLRGGDGNDYILGGAGDDTIEGGAGRDNLTGGFGDDLIDGGEGDDYVSSYEGSDTIHLGNGLNTLFMSRGLGTADHLVVTGGDDRDSVSLSFFGSTDFDISLGGGDDRLELTMLKSHAVLDLGAGADVIRMWEYGAGIIGSGRVTVAGFTPGAGGDRLDWNGFLAAGLTGWSHSLNPFGTGHLRIRQVGDDTLLEIDSNGGANSFVTLFTFKDADSSLFTEENFDGYRPDGGASTALNLTGTDAAETFNGSGAGDTIDGGAGGDMIEGGGGNDTLIGGAGRDTLRGEVGDDILQGGADDDDLNGGYGADTLHGGDGNDYFSDDRGGDTFHGDGGNDIMVFNPGLSAGLMRAFGGEGDDGIYMYAYHGGTYIVDGGAGADRIQISQLRTTADVTLGAGADTLALDTSNPTFIATLGSIVVRDFETGAGGDKLDFAGFLSAALTGWDGAANPFAANLGFVRLLQSNSDTLLQIDTNGGGNSYRTIVTFKNLAPGAFTAQNLGGFPPDGSAVPPKEIIGTEFSDELRGGSGDDVIEGLGGHDELSGGSGSDELRGGSGNDYLYGETGNDSLDGGDGDDHLDGGLGDDVLEGGAGDDSFFDSHGSDLIHGGAGEDDIHVQRFDPAVETILVDAGDDDDKVTLHTYVTGTSVQVDAGAGDDAIVIMAMKGAATLTLGDGADSIAFVESYSQDHQGSVRVQDFAAGAGGDRVEFIGFLTEGAPGWDGNSNPFDTGFARIVQSGNDTLLQFDQDAGAGVHAFFTAMTFANLNAYALTAANIGYSFATLYGSGGSDHVVGNGGANHVVGGAGNDHVDGGDGDDLVYGEDGADLLDGGSGVDILDGGLGNDVLDGGAGADTMRGGAGDDVYVVDDAGDIVEEQGNGGVDEVRTSLATYSLLGTNVERLSATSDSAHELRGSAAANRVEGGAGNDFLLMQDGGDDIALGGEGNDVLYFGTGLSAGDVADGGAGRDALVLQGNVTVALSNANLVGIESISIQSGANTRYGDTANNFYDFDVTTADGNVAAGQQLIVNASSLRAGEDFTFDGSAESDGKFVVYGGHGVDDLTGGDGVDVFFFEGQRWGPDDKVDGGDGRDALVISAGSGLTHIEFEADSFTNIESISVNNHFATDPSQKPSYELVLHNGNVAPGGTLIVNGSSIPLGQVVGIDGRGVHDGNLTLIGGGGHDTVYAGSGADLIIGGGGADGLAGGAGADTFRYDAASDSLSGLSDLIADFQTGLDKIDLGRIDANTLVGGDQAFAFIGAGAFSGSAGELRSYEEGGYRWVAGDTNGDGGADFAIAFQVGTAPLVQGDFLL